MNHETPLIKLTSHCYEREVAANAASCFAAVLGSKQQLKLSGWETSSRPVELIKVVVQSVTYRLMICATALSTFAFQ